MLSKLKQYHREMKKEIKYFRNGDNNTTKPETVFVAIPRTVCEVM